MGRDKSGRELTSEHKVYKKMCTPGDHYEIDLKKLQFMNYEFKKKYFREENLEIGSNSGGGRELGKKRNGAHSKSSGQALFLVGNIEFEFKAWFYTR